MLSTQIEMEPEIAKRHYLDYRRMKEDLRTEEDREIQKSYLELSRGRALVNARDAIEVAGVGEDGRPRIAFCRASARWCYLRTWQGAMQFCDRSRWDHNPNYRQGLLKLSVTDIGYSNEVRTVVPPIPPEHRPAANLDRYWLMWEVGEGGWKDVPGDPALLKRINPLTFSVLAVWDLTEVERMVLRGRE